MAAPRLFTRRLILYNYRIARRNLTFAVPRDRGHVHRDDEYVSNSKFLEPVKRHLPYACFSTALPRSAASLAYKIKNPEAVPPGTASEGSVSDVDPKNQNTEAVPPVKASDGSVSDVASKNQNPEAVPPVTASDGSVSDVSTAYLSTSSLPPIPDPEVIRLIDDAQAVQLGGWYPPGIIQQILEYLHVTFDLPWWGAIVTLTCITRIILLPLAIKMRRATIQYQNQIPMIQELQQKVNDARLTGNYNDAMIYGQKLMEVTKGVYTKNMIIPNLIQLPIFVSFFISLRQIGNSDLETFRTGGLWWFTDLCMPDEFHILPLVISGTIFATFRLGTETPMGALDGGVLSRYRIWLEAGFSSLVFYFIMNFPTSVLCYWSVSSLITMLQNVLMSNSRVKELLKIPPRTVNLKQCPDAKMGITESMKNWRVLAAIEAREKVNVYDFEKAKVSPIRRTFKFDPTKPRPDIIPKK